MTVQWNVGVAEHHKDELAEVNLKAVGIPVWFPRGWARERTYQGKMKGTYELINTPYFYAQFDGRNDEEYALAKRQRGVAWFLEGAGSRYPGSVPQALIDGHRSREDAERANLVVKHGKGRKDLENGKQYRITRGSFRDKIGKLVDHHNGWAWLDVGVLTPQIADCDIDLVPEVEQRRA